MVVAKQSSTSWARGRSCERDVQLGETTLSPGWASLQCGPLFAALSGTSSTEDGAFDVIPAQQPGAVSFLAKPSRLSVGLHNGISGAVYVFDVYQNLITAPTPVNFELSTQSGAMQSQTVGSLVMASPGPIWIRPPKKAWLIL